MSTVEMKLEIPLLLDMVEDDVVDAEFTILKIHSAKWGNAPLIPCDMEGNPLFNSTENMLAEYDRRLENMRKGNYVTLEELEKKSAKWLKQRKAKNG